MGAGIGQSRWFCLSHARTCDRDDPRRSDRLERSADRVKTRRLGLLCHLCEAPPQTVEIAVHVARLMDQRVTGAAYQ